MALAVLFEFLLCFRHPLSFLLSLSKIVSEFSMDSGLLMCMCGKSLKFVTFEGIGVKGISVCLAECFDMTDVFGFALLAVASVIAVVEPGSNVAIYLSLTEGMGRDEKRRIVRKAMGILFCSGLFALGGQLVFSFFNITISAFLIAGGVLLVDVALKMLHPGRRNIRRGNLRNCGCAVGVSFDGGAGLDYDGDAANVSGQRSR